MNSDHLVLVGANGKQASRKDAWILALQMWAEQECAAGRGGGVVGLLLPKTNLEQQKLVAAKKKYQLKRVRCRNNQERKMVRNMVVYDTTLLVKILDCYDRKCGHIPGAIQINKIAVWVCNNLKNHHSELCKIITNHSYALADRQSPGWWEKMFADCRKHYKTKNFKTAS